MILLEKPPFNSPTNECVCVCACFTTDGECQDVEAKLIQANSFHKHPKEKPKFNVDT